MKQSHKVKKRSFTSLSRKWRYNYDLVLLFLVPLMWYIIFKYIPIYGIQIAFRRFNPSLGITKSDWVGLAYFKQFFDSYYFGRLLKNTVVLSLYQLAIGFPVPIFLALLINELPSKRLQKVVQNVTYIPYFLSVVVIVSLLNLFSKENGIFNQFLGIFGVPSMDYMAKTSSFRSLYVFSGVWQNMGFNAIIYIAALGAIDVSFFEAASIDGASRLQKIRYISLPSLLPTILVLFILRIGSVMEVGFEKVFLMQNTVNLEVSDVISTFIYQNGVQKGQFSYSAAVGLFNSVINFLLLVTANVLSRKTAKVSLW